MVLIDMTEAKLSARWWFLLHSWLALPIWAFLFFVCLTGSIATVSQEIVWMVKPEVRANPPSADARMLGYDEIMALMVREHPQAVMHSISRPVKSIFAWTVRASYPDTSQVTHYVNPYTGHIQGSEPTGLTFRQFIRALHGWLLVPFSGGYNWGWYAVSLLSLPLMGLVVSGLVVYKRFWRGYLHPKLRIDRGARVFLGDLHRMIGIWSMPFILIMAITALWFLVQMALGHAGFKLPSTAPQVPVLIERDDVPFMPNGQPPARIGLNQAAAVMREQLPGVDPTILSLGNHAFSPITLRGQGVSWPLLDEFAQINPYNGKVVYARRIADQSIFELFTQSMRPMHTGDFAGLGLKLVYFVFGLLLTAMVASGLLIWTKRTVKATRAVIRSQPVADDKAIDAPLLDSLTPSFMGEQGGASSRWRRWRFHLSAMVLLAPMVIAPFYFTGPQGVGANLGLGQRTVGTLQAGPWMITLGEWQTSRPTPQDGEYEKRFALALCSSCVSQVKAAYLRIGKPRGDIRTAGALFSGSPYRQLVTLRMPGTVRPDVDVWLTLEGWDGSVHRVSLPLSDASPITHQWALERSK